MSVAKVTEIIASSSKSFEHAIENGVKRASKTIKGITSAWVKDQSVTVSGGKVKEYRVNMMVTFVLDEPKTKKKKATKKKAAKKKASKR